MLLARTNKHQKWTSAKRKQHIKQKYITKWANIRLERSQSTLSLFRSNMDSEKNELTTPSSADIEAAYQEELKSPFLVNSLSHADKVIDLGAKLRGETWFGSPDNEGSKIFVETELFATILVIVLFVLLVFAIYLEQKHRERSLFIKINGPVSNWLTGFDFLA